MVHCGGAGWQLVVWPAAILFILVASILSLNAVN
jgi:hypothetical protein